MSNDAQKITVKPDTLANMVSDIGKGNYRIPQFQREFVWPRTKVVALFDSIYHEFPIGSFFLWKAGRENNHLFRQTIDLDVGPVGEHDSVSFIIDGQQRSTSVYVALKGLTVVKEDGSSDNYRNVCFDVESEKFTFREPNDKRYISVSDIWNPNRMDELMDQLEGDRRKAFRKCWRALQTYPVSLVEVRDKDLAEVCEIFQRINQGGQRLSRFDLIAAMTFRKDFDLRVKLREDIFEPLEEKRFGRISDAIVTQVLALLKTGACTQRNEFSLTADDIAERWDAARTGILLAADALRRSMGVVNYGYLPYDPLLTLLSYYFAKSGNRSLPPDHMQWVQRWFWRSSFGRHYGSGGATKIGQDRALFDGLIQGSPVEFNPPLNITILDLVSSKMTLTQSAIRNAFLCLLAIQKPRHLANNAELDLVNGGIVGFTDNEKHHVFPRAHLIREGDTDAGVHALPNFCFLTAELNKRILDEKPSKYFAELRAENSNFDEAARSNLLPVGKGAGIEDDDYNRFLQVRGKLIIDEIRRLCGEITTPREDERQLKVERLEKRIREVINRTLTVAEGTNYWKSRIPQQIRQEAEKRIQSAINKYPDVRPEVFQEPRRRLAYCNPMDYLTIIENGANWPAFESVFRKKGEVQRYLAGFSEYRNVVMHNREMTELIDKNGEAAMIWLANVLPDVKTSF